MVFCWMSFTHEIYNNTYFTIVNLFTFGQKGEDMVLIHVGLNLNM